MFKKCIQIVVFSAALLTLQSCGTIFGENTRAVAVHSNPQGAGIYIDGQRHGTTPAQVTLPNYIYGGKTLTLKKEGYHEQSTTIGTAFQPCGLFNVFFWPGFIIDGAVGNTVKINPSQLNTTVELQRIDSK
jgi:hypothetical protein